MDSRQYKCALLAVAAITSSAVTAKAAENGVINYPAGSPGIFLDAFPPLPGIFAVSQTNYTSSKGLYDGNGRKLPVNFSVASVSETARFLASWPTQFLGAHLYSQLVVPLVHVESTNPGGSFVTNGFANITVSPLIMDWRLGQFQSVFGGLDIIPNTGTYSASRTLNVGTNYTSISPTFGYHYLDPNGFEFAIGPRFLFNTGANNASVNRNVFPFVGQSYRSGDAFVTDFHIGYNFGQWKVGAVGGYVNQYTDDKVNGVKAFNAAGVQNGNRLKSFAAGPSLSYNLGPVQINVNYQHTFAVANGTKGDSVWANVAFPLWMPGPPPGAPVVK